MADLFGNIAPPIPGLRIKPDVISEGQESDLIQEIEQIDLPHFQFQGWSSKRRTRSFGWLYDFRDASFGPAEPIPQFLLPLKHVAAGFADVHADDIVQASVIKYEPGAGIGWHVDRPELDAVIGISLGAEAVMRFRRRTDTRFERTSVPLPPRSMYVLDGEVRYEWEHSIAPIGETRWSVTFRGLSEKGKQKALLRANRSASEGSMEHASR